MPPNKGGKRPPKGGKGSAKGKAPSGKAQHPQKSGSVTAPKKKAVKKKSRWSVFIHRTLKQLHQNLTISSRGMTIMGSFVEDMFERIQAEAVNVAKISNKMTLTAREVQTAGRLLLPKELAKHAMSEGTKAVSKYNTARQALLDAQRN